MTAPKNADFEALVAPYRAELHTHCYRMLGSLHHRLQPYLDEQAGAHLMRKQARLLSATCALASVLGVAWHGAAGAEAEPPAALAPATCTVDSLLEQLRAAQHSGSPALQRYLRTALALQVRAVRLALPPALFGEQRRACRAHEVARDLVGA